MPYHLTADERSALWACGRMDTVEIAMLDGATLSMIALNCMIDEKPLTLQTLVEHIDRFKKEPEYPRFREGFIRSRELKSKIVDLADWDEDKVVFEAMGMNPEALNAMKLFLMTLKPGAFTYFEAYNLYAQKLAAEQPPKVERFKYDFAPLEDLDAVLKAAKAADKNALLFFNGYTAANCRKMESLVLSDSTVMAMIDAHFVAFEGYADDTQPYIAADESDGSAPKQTFSHKGAQIMDLQQQKFGTTTSPLFVIIDANGKELARAGYMREVQDFVAFLKKGMR